MNPKIIKGGRHTDSRGALFYNNDFDVSSIKRMYVIQNENIDFIRGWQGHKIEQRWFSVIKGSFRIQLIAIDDWSNPSKDLKTFNFVIHSEELDVLHVPSGYVSSIQSLKEEAKLLVMSDYLLGTIQDEYRFDIEYFSF